jgi:Zn finger protein HypA/HybF involved in hydrogenase expression
MIDSVYKGGFRKKAKCFSCQKLLVKDEPVVTDKNRYYCKKCGESVRSKRIELLEGLITNVKGIK